MVVFSFPFIVTKFRKYFSISTLKTGVHLGNPVFPSPIECCYKKSVPKSVDKKRVCHVGMNLENGNLFSMIFFIFFYLEFSFSCFCILLKVPFLSDQRRIIFDGCKATKDCIVRTPAVRTSLFHYYSDCTLRSQIR